MRVKRTAVRARVYVRIQGTPPPAKNKPRELSCPGGCYSAATKNGRGGRAGGRTGWRAGGRVGNNFYACIHYDYIMYVYACEYARAAAAARRGGRGGV